MRAKYLIFGDGLLGHIFNNYEDCTVLSRQQCDITKMDDVRKIIDYYRPQVVINCAGIVPKNGASIEYMFKVNSFAPHYLAEICGKKCFLIHVSTDCVFKGDKGQYIETDRMDATDIYGMSKIFGETHETGLVVRTSFVGYPDPKQRGLLSWAQQQEEIIGYDNVFWNGLTNQELAKKLLELADLRVVGTRHVYSYTVSKYELLVCASEILDWNIPVIPESEISAKPHVSDKTLSSIYYTGFVAKPIRQQLEELWNQ